MCIGHRTSAIKSYKQSLPDFSLRLALKPAKPFVIHGVDGVSQKGPKQGEASHYLSCTRLEAKGTLQQNGKTVSLSGTSWMDHEFFTEGQNPELAGWDWFAIQLDNDEDLMLYRLRLKSGALSAYSSGTLIGKDGKAHHLNAGDFTLTPSRNWTSSISKANYPLAWKITVPSAGIELTESTRLDEQELYTEKSVSPGYWEGAVNYAGTAYGKPVKGVGYLEMTGYQAPFRIMTLGPRGAQTVASVGPKIMTVGKPIAAAR